jgi:N-dimethylarginine dimethylaminohydrolase
MPDDLLRPPSEVGRLARVVLKHARDAFHSDVAIESEWRVLNFTSPPNLQKAIAEYDRFQEIIASTGAEIRWLPVRPGTGLDSIYVRDASVICDRGAIICNMGKPQRAWEPSAQATAFREWGIPIAGEIRAPGRLEGGDVVWLDARTIAVGRGYRTNDEGIRQLKELLGASVDDVIVVPLPHWKGAGDVFHLMSIISPVDHDLSVVYSPLLPVPFLETLLGRGMQLVEVPDGEFDSLGSNVLAIEPRRCVMAAGSPRTRRLLEAAGAQVHVYVGSEISLKGGGGPTCLTRPIERF